MGHLFLDIETFVDEENKKSGLNPFEPESKVLMINFNHYDTPKFTSSDIKPPTFLKEWESSEKEVLTNFYNRLKETIPQDRYQDSEGHFRCGLKIIGYNVLGFDLPYLLGRMMINKIDTNRNLIQFLYTDSVKIDLMQISMMISKKIDIYNDLLPISQINANSYFKIPIKKGTGLFVSDYYRKGEYEKIMDYVSEEFTFEHLYLALKDLVRHTQKEVTYKKSFLDNISKIISHPATRI